MDKMTDSQTICLHSWPIITQFPFPCSKEIHVGGISLDRIKSFNFLAIFAIKKETLNGFTFHLFSKLHLGLMYKHWQNFVIAFPLSAADQLMLA